MHSQGAEPRQPQSSPGGGGSTSSSSTGSNGSASTLDGAARSLAARATNEAVDTAAPLPPPTQAAAVPAAAATPVAPSEGHPAALAQHAAPPASAATAASEAASSPRGAHVSAEANNVVTHSGRPAKRPRIGASRDDQAAPRAATGAAVAQLPRAAAVPEGSTTAAAVDEDIVMMGSENSTHALQAPPGPAASEDVAATVLKLEAAAAAVVAAAAALPSADAATARAAAADGADEAVSEDETADSEHVTEESEEEAGDPQADARAAPGKRRGAALIASGMAGLLSALRTLNSVLTACRGPAYVPGGLPLFAGGAAAITRVPATASVGALLSLVAALRTCVRRGLHVGGLLRGAATDKPGSLRFQTVLAALEAALAACLLLSSPHVDPKLLQEELITDVLAVARWHMVQHVVPCYDGLDPAWAAQAQASVSSSSASSSSHLGDNKGKGKGKSKVATAGGIFADGSTSAPGPTAGRVTKAMLQSAQGRMRGVTVLLCDLLARLCDVAAVVPLSEPMLGVLIELAARAATQTTSAPTSGGAVANATANAAASLASIEQSLQTAAMTLLAVVVERFPEQRPVLVAEAVGAHVKLGSGKRFVRGFVVPVAVPRPHLAMLTASPSDAGPAASLLHTVGSSSSLLSSASGAGGGLASGNDAAAGFAPNARVHTCAALACHLLHAAASLPTAEECAAADESRSARADAAAARGQHANGAATGANGAGKHAGSTGGARGKAKNGKREVEGVELDQGANVHERATSASVAHEADRGKALRRAASAPALSADAANGSAPASPRSFALAPSGGAGVAPQAQGHLEAVRFARLYVARLLAWVSRKLAGELTSGLLGSSLAATSSTTDDEDPRALLRRFADDLCTLMDVPDWPGAQLLLSQLIAALIAKLPPAHGAAQPASGAAAAPATAVAGAKHDHGLGALAVSVLGSVLTRLQCARTYAREHSVNLPPPVEGPVNADAQPSSAGEVVRCICGQRDSRVFMLDCDVCHCWFHGPCVGVSEETPLAWWQCDDCCIRQAVAAQKVGRAFLWFCFAFALCAVVAVAGPAAIVPVRC